VRVEIAEGAARALAGAAFEPRAGTVVYVNTVLVGPDTAPVGAATLHADVPALLVFRDEMPGANWMHPCRYALVDPHTGSILAQAASDRPPAFGRLPRGWVIASDPDGLADLVVV
jgi:hypothetical protein